IFAPPNPFGTWRSIDPFSSVMSRVPVLKQKNVSAPMRVRVSSWKSNSDRDCTPVWRPRSSLITSRIAAGWPPFSGSTTLTRLIIFVTSADVSGPATDGWLEKMQPAATTRERLALSIGDTRRYIITIIATVTQLESNVQSDPASDVKNVIGKRRSIGVVSGPRYRRVQAQPPDRIVAKRKRQRLIVIDPVVFVVKLRCVAIKQIGIERSRDLQMIRGVNSCLIALLRSRCRYAEHSADPSRQRVRSPKDKSPLASNREGVILQQFATGRIEELSENKRGGKHKQHE